jgi:hypothetical protein
MDEKWRPFKLKIGNWQLEIKKNGSAPNFLDKVQEVRPRINYREPKSNIEIRNNRR